MKITPFPAESVTWHCSFPGNLSKLLRLGLHTFAMCNIAIKLVVDFSTGSHTDRFEATSSEKPFFFGFFTRAFAWPRGASSWNVCICGAAFPFCRWQAGSMFPSWCHVENHCHIVTHHQTSECHGYVHPQLGSIIESLASVELSAVLVSRVIAGFLKTLMSPGCFLP